MLFRFISKPSHLRLLTLISSKTTLSSPYPPPLLPRNPSFSFILQTIRCFSNSNNNNNNNNNNSKDQSTPDIWKLSPENDHIADSVFGEDAGNLDGIVDVDAAGSGVSKAEDESWSKGSTERGDDDIFEGIDKEVGSKNGDGDDEWATAEGYTPWTLVDEEKDVFDIGESVLEARSFGDESVKSVKSERSEEDKQLEKEEQELSAVLKGPNRAFGDLIAASGITDAMLDSLIALKDLEGVEGLPPLREIEDMRYEKNTRKSTRAEIERQKQEEVAKARVRQVDEKGRAYGTGRRKCSIARVWVLPGDGKFIINDKQFDVYFPALDHRAALLRPFSETKTLGLWDVNCTVKGGGVSGQVDAIRLGISRALQKWEPGLRPPLRAAGFLTRDPRVVERKKPGKAKARKSFQWVKR